ncbi:PREDICTED: uncharacterized protein LOC104786955 isoform X2 [Camelina sativa]|uniref:Uncharacterized protein LOC104786581 isoform X2 n=1 Tax=Camelina sativa TaxID=90675 RepID=A0ABM1RR46_CAMSA|nr:PREDICTED: uncharacterized protein LOC104786581 isoform X2 [Camelina sativa]XP_019101484.1 PREDICTED: uncharacterized protein LOC104786955 isoform X2 [Camelina sativa]
MYSEAQAVLSSSCSLHPPLVFSTSFMALVYALSHFSLFQRFFFVSEESFFFGLFLKRLKLCFHGNIVFFLFDELTGHICHALWEAKRGVFQGTYSMVLA